MILAGKAYYDGVAKIGEIATGSPVSTELGELTIHVYKSSPAVQEADESVSGGSGQDTKGTSGALQFEFTLAHENGEVSGRRLGLRSKVEGGPSQAS